LSTPDRVSLRPAAESDGDFLRALFASTRERELAFLGAAAQAPFLDLQFKAQRESYRRSYPQATDAIIEVGGAAAGHLYVDRAGAGLHLIDLALLPEYRGRGIGTALLRALLAEAAQGKGKLTLSVAASNPAQSLYERLGFKTVGSDGVYLFQTAGGDG
jgi:ribosomal protein S18 acetylase RimI-like enzyme